jgi:glycosyltransferase involved in cell wall biosynthesis
MAASSSGAGRARVAHFGIDANDPGGMAAMLRDVAQSPLAQAYDLTFIPAYRHAAGPAARLALFSVALLRLIIWCLRPGARLVHVHTSVRGSWYRKAVAVVTAKLLRRPVILQLHAGPYDINAFWQGLDPIRRAVFRWAFGRADRVLSVSQAGAGSLREFFGLTDVEVIPNAAPRPTVGPPPTAAQDGRVGVLYAGGFRDASKGGRIMVEALPLLAGQGVVRVEMAGPGEPPDGWSRALAPGAAAWLGWLDADAKAAALGRAAIVTLPSLSEGLPIWLLEAMVNGHAVVATRTGGMPEIITDGVDGVLVEPGNPVALTAAILELAADPARRERLGTAARQRAARLNQDEVYGPLLRMYGELAGAASRPRR